VRTSDKVAALAHLGMFVMLVMAAVMYDRAATRPRRTAAGRRRIHCGRAGTYSCRMQVTTVTDFGKSLSFFNQSPHSTTSTIQPRA
jgi:hypothetical protein